MSFAKRREDLKDPGVRKRIEEYLKEGGMAEAKVEVRVEGDTVGIKFPPPCVTDGFHWLSLDEVWAFQRDLAVAVREAWVNHEERLVEDVVRDTGRAE